MLPLVILATLWFACVAVFLYAIIVAPRGYEDRSGFHFGDEPQTDERIDRPLRRPQRRRGRQVEPNVPTAHPVA